MNPVLRLVIATALLLVCAHSLPLGMPTEEQPLREFKKVLKLAKSVLVSESEMLSALQLFLLAYLSGPSFVP